MNITGSTGSVPFLFLIIISFQISDFFSQIILKRNQPISSYNLIKLLSGPLNVIIYFWLWASVGLKGNLTSIYKKKTYIFYNIFWQAIIFVIMSCANQAEAINKLRISIYWTKFCPGVRVPSNKSYRRFSYFYEKYLFYCEPPPQAMFTIKY